VPTCDYTNISMHRDNGLFYNVLKTSSVAAKFG